MENFNEYRTSADSQIEWDSAAARASRWMISSETAKREEESEVYLSVGRKNGAQYRWNARDINGRVLARVFLSAIFFHTFSFTIADKNRQTGLSTVLIGRMEKHPTAPY